jgi:hypothetical protein
MLGYFWFLVKRSFHGTLRTLEIGEAIVATVVHVFGYCLPAHKEALEVLFVALVALLVLTFFFGLFLAAYASNHVTGMGASVGPGLATSAHVASGLGLADLRWPRS